ncbi:MAG: Gfo/Idh/MocA family oxidoreductase [Clostridiales bacterium]|nr:Gfo/Idh/MocA family oxidoreductase [Clostridiales bacterium]
MANQVRYGMLGGDIHAFIGEVHRKAINFDTRAKLVSGCFSNVQEYNIETAQAYNVDSKRVYPDYKAFIENEKNHADRPDFVVITTPNFLHYEMAKALLEADFNVVCEKPLCFEVEEAEELVSLAKAKKLLFAVSYGYTGYTMVKVMKEMVENGKIGKIISVNAEYSQDWLLDDLSPKEGAVLNLSVWRKDPKVAGISNCVGDIGTHIENLVHYITGLSLKRVTATVNRYDHPLDLNANMLVEYDNGANGAYWCSQVASGHLNDLIVRIYGDQGSLEWVQEHPDFVRFTPKGEAPQMLGRANGYITEKAGAYSRIPAGHPEGLYVAFANIYKNYISAVIAQKEGKDTASFDFPTVEDGLNGVKFVHAVMESGEKGTWVDL